MEPVPELGFEFGVEFGIWAGVEEGAGATELMTTLFDGVGVEDGDPEGLVEASKMATHFYSSQSLTHLIDPGQWIRDSRRSSSLYRVDT